jgi:hypothetical protein
MKTLGSIVIALAMITTTAYAQETKTKGSSFNCQNELQGSKGPCDNRDTVYAVGTLNGPSISGVGRDGKPMPLTAPWPKNGQGVSGTPNGMTRTPWGMMPTGTGPGGVGTLPWPGEGGNTAAAAKDF